MKRSPNEHVERSSVRHLFPGWLALLLSFSALGVRAALAAGEAPAADAALLVQARAAIAELSARGVRFEPPDLATAPLARLQRALVLLC